MLVSVLALACAPSSSDSMGDEHSSSESSGSEAPRSPQCECIELTPDNERPAPEFPTCGELQCPVITPNWDVRVGQVSYDAEDEANIDCALQALRDRSPGLLRITSDSGSSSGDWYVLVGDEDDAVYRGWVRNGQAHEVADAEAGPLRSPDYFEACLADPDPGARRGCIQAALERVDEICDAGWEYVAG